MSPKGPHLPDGGAWQLREVSEPLSIRELRDELDHWLAYLDGSTPTNVFKVHRAERESAIGAIGGFITFLYVGP